jgi:hypothetical protein
MPRAEMPAVMVVRAVDPTGAGVRDTRVRAFSEAGGEPLSALVDQEGVAHLTVQPGVYRVEARHSFFAGFLARRVSAQAGCVTWVDATLDMPPLECDP